MKLIRRLWTMKNRKADMQAVFAELSEENKDIMILIAKGMKAAQEAAEELYIQKKSTI